MHACRSEFRGSRSPARPGSPRPPITVAQLRELGYDVVVESGAGAESSFADERLRGGGRRDRRGGRGLAAPTSCSRSTRRARTNRSAARRGDAGQPARPGAQPGPGRDARAPADHGARDGRGAAHLARAVAGRAQLDGQHRRLPRGDRGGARLRPVLHRPGDRRRQGAAGQGAGRRRRSGRASPRSARRAAWARSCAPPTRARRSPSRCARSAGEFLAVESEEREVSATGYAKEMSEDYNARAAAALRRAGARRRHHHHHRADPRPARAAADHRGDGRHA